MEEHNTTITYEIHLTSDVATFWYDKFTQFQEQTKDDPEFETLTFSGYLGGQVLTNLMRLMQGTVPE